MGKKVENMTNGKEKLSIPVMLLCIVGVVLIGLGVMLIKSYDFRLNIIPTKGNVISFQTRKDSEGNQDTIVLINYTTSSGDYTAELVSNDETYQMGSQVILYYDFFVPESVNLQPMGYWGYISIIIGLILVVKTGPKFLRIIRDNYVITD